MNNLSNEELVQVHATAREARLPVVWTEKKALAHFKIKITPEVVEAMARELLALREAGKEPVAYIFKHPTGKLFWALTDESNKGRSGVIPVYAAPQLPAVPDDTRRMDWLCSMVVDVREPLVYGSHSIFWSQCDSADDEPHHTTLREQIDAMIAAAPKPE